MPEKQAISSENQIANPSKVNLSTTYRTERQNELGNDKMSGA